MLRGPSAENCGFRGVAILTAEGGPTAYAERVSLAQGENT
jgi:hypothetical protein